MYRTITDLTEDWRRETALTMRVLRALNDSSLGQKVTPDGRSLGFLAWHITLSLGETGERTGLHVAAPAEDAPMPISAHEISAHIIPPPNPSHTRFRSDGRTLRSARK